MHFYQFNIGDYRRRTNHLSPLDNGIYRMLIDTYYLEEKPLTLDLKKLMRTHSIRSADEKESLTNILEDFFVETEDGYINKACDEVIVKYQEKSAKAKASADARWHPEVKPKMRTHSEGNANQEPITNNQEPKEKGKKKKTSRFTPPTINLVKEYAKEKDLADYSLDFFEFYETKNWFVGKNKMVKWQMAYSRWCRKQKDFSPTAQADSRVNTNQPKPFEELEKERALEWKTLGFKSDEAYQKHHHEVTMARLEKMGAKR